MTKHFPKIGLALSGGGSRAMAFHLGCLRALHQKGILDRISILSSVSGGSVIAALYAYWDDCYDQFEERVRKQLKMGYFKSIVWQTFCSPEILKILRTLILLIPISLVGTLTFVLAKCATLFGLSSDTALRFAKYFQLPLRRKFSRTTAFERHLRLHVFGTRKMDNVKRKNLNVVINATELRTESAFRFGSKESGCWRYGILAGEPPLVSKAVAASAAYPALLPAFDEKLPFYKNGTTSTHRVIITDGGVYDNLGITPMLPGRSPKYSTHTEKIDFIICCDAGTGLPPGHKIPRFWISRMQSVATTVHRRTHALSYKLLHHLAETKTISGFLLPYLGQQDSRLPIRPKNLVPREAVSDYPTDFSPMSNETIDRLSKRGEQLTHLLIEDHLPDL